MDDLKGTASYVPDELNRAPNSKPKVTDGTSGSPEWDVIMIGAGMSGIYTNYRMLQLGLKVKVIEAGSAVGGTWYWNRYPGARFDSESYSYAYSWCPEILNEWHWKEHFAAQPETEAYANFVCDRYDLRQNMQFNTRIAAAHWQEGPGEKYWKLVDEEGREYTTRFLVSCMGILTQPTLPNIPGVEDYKGVAHHTARWPKEGVSFDGKRVAVIGTGATGIQTIQEVVKTVGHLTVFQRTPNWTSPMHNAKIDEEEMDDIRRRYPEIFKACMDTPTCFIHRPNAKSTTDVTPEEREAFWEDLYAGRGFGIWLSNYKDVLRDPEANDLMSAFAAKKIRQRVKDPKTAEKLTPKNHGFGTRRLPLETNYLEAYNQSNVRLIDINEDPIEQITEKGIKTKNEDLEFDMIVYATGFDAVTGAFDAIDIRGTGGQSLRDLWEEGPKTYLGLTLHGFPNLGMVMGPHQMFGNFPRSIEYATVWITRLIQFCRDKGYTSFEATQQGMDDWTQHVYDGMKGFLSANVDSWMTGVNKNVARRQKRIVARYNGSAIEFRKFCEDVASSGYKTLVFDGDSQREQPREQPRL